jgi:hypothetical protein
MTKASKKKSYKTTEIFLEGWYSVAHLEDLIKQVKENRERVNKREQANEVQ